MKKKVLLVEDAPAVRSSIAALLEAHYDVREVSSAEEGLDACEKESPFAVTLADHGLPGMSGLDLLRRIGSAAPTTVGVLLSGDARPELLSEAVSEPRVFRLLTKPCPAEILRGAVDAAAARHAEFEEGLLHAEELAFGQASYAQIVDLMAGRLRRQSRAMHTLQGLAIELCEARTTEEMAQVAAAATSRILEGCGVHVQIWDRSGQGPGAEASTGRELSSRLHRVPLVTAEGPIGEITIDGGGPGGRRLDEAGVDLLDSIASVIAVAAHNELRRVERDQALHATMLAMARLSEHRDQETGRHLERVSTYCRMLATGLREDGHHRDVITDAFVEDLARASPLHDIGKVGIPDAILLKPGRLTPGEWEIMKTHARMGAATIESVMREFGRQPVLEMGRDITWCHHEKWDGTGYPRGLAGEAIPLVARILALADVYDALTSRRPYKAPWTHAASVEWIVPRAGGHFDPDVVAVFARRLPRFDRIRCELADADEPVTDPV